MSKVFKVGMIGVGGISRSHQPGWAASPHAEVVSAADLSEANLQLFGETYGVSRLSTRPEDVINDPDIDIVDICTPNMYHTELVIAALEAGKHVICEKPLAATPGEIHRMIAARDANGRELMTAQHQRFVGVSQAIKRQIEAGALGDIYHARGWMLRRSAYIPTPTFVHRKHAGGGVVIDIGVHILDLILWLMGNPRPVAVSGVARTELTNRPGAFSLWHPASMPTDADVEEFAAAFVRFENGATLILEVSWALHHDTEIEDMQGWLYGTEGGVHWPGGKFIHTDYARRQLKSTTLDSVENFMEPHAYECYAFAEALANGEPSPVPPEQSLQVAQILDGIYRSHAQRREVAID